MVDSVPIRVAQVVRPAEGGIRRHVSLLIAGLDSSRFNSTLFAPAAFTIEKSVPHVIRESLDVAASTRIFRDMRAIRSLTEMLKGRFDLVHAHGLRAAFVGVIAARRAQIPAMFTAHNVPASLSTIQRLALVLVSRRSQAIVAVSNAVSKGLESCGVAGNKIRVIPNGIPLDEYMEPPPLERAQLGITGDSAILAYVGRLSPEKGIQTLLDAFEIVTARSNRSHLLIVGSGPDDAMLRARARALENVHFLGTRSDVPSIMRCANLVVVPSYAEGQGIVAIEAMASARAVVATNVGGLAETVIDGETGILTPPHNSQLLAGAIESLIGNPERAAAMGNAGQKRAFALYAVKHMVDSLQELYANVSIH